MEQNRQRVTLVGRPNVGKSTIFNLLAVGQKAIVAPQPGVTRDARTSPGRLGELEFVLVDTAGQEPNQPSDAMARDLTKLAQRASQQADILIYVIDGRDGVLPADEELSRQLHRLDKPVIPIINKADVKTAEDVQDDAIALGLGTPLLLSATHNSGLPELEEALEEFISPRPEEEEAPEAEFVADEDMTEEVEIFTPDAPLRMAIVGRPNVGKSTLVNALLREEAMLAGPTAGLTRESIRHQWQVGDHTIELIDTPGLRKKAKVHENVEQMSVGDALDATDKANVVALVLDSTHFYYDRGIYNIFDQQDMAIVDRALRRGTPLVVVLNKWDDVSDAEQALGEARAQLNERLSAVRNVPIVTISALHKKGLQHIFPAVLDVYRRSHTRVATSALNRWMENITSHNPPPLYKGKGVKLKFMAQKGVQPPTFHINTNRPKNIPAHYKRYLLNQLRDMFDLDGVPLKMIFTQSKNPFLRS